MNRKGLSLFTAYCLLSFLLILACKEEVKEPSVAGSFYPADANVLKETVAGLLAAAANTPVDGKLIALIAPHAGYQFSGQIAAYSYKHLIDRNITTVILIGPSHHSAFNGASVYAKGSMKTPFGNIKINERLAKSLINEKSHVSFYPAAFDKEHSLEVQLPFLQRTLKNFKIVPILIGMPTRESFEHLTERLIEILRKDDKVIMVASTDLSHFHDYNTAVNMDKKVIDSVERMSLENLDGYLMSGEGEMCGGYPVLFTMAVARGLGATNGVLYRYANSGDVTGDKDRVVGYAAIGLYKSPLTEEEKRGLLSMAKNTITRYVTYKKIPDFKVKDPRLLANGAAFVTINRNGSLRGCIGNIQPIMPLYKCVIQNAVAASSHDYRFSPMNREELKDIEVEVTILSPLEPLDDVSNIKIGTHGLYIVNGRNTGILLPQVAKEYKWDSKTFLKQVSVKAGLPEDAWKSSRLYTFTADILK